MDLYLRIAWFATLISVLIPIRCAATFLTHNARLFTVLCLFALAWALLLPYYGKVAQSELFPAFGGFLLVYAGGLVQRETLSRNQNHEIIGVGKTERLALWFLLILATPSGLSVTFPDSMQFGFSVPQIELILACAMNIIGAVSIGVGVDGFCSRTLHRVLIAALTVYVLLEFSFTATMCRDPIATMPPLFRILFAIAKVALASLFSYIITTGGMTQAHRKLPTSEKWMMLLTGMGAQQTT